MKTIAMILALGTAVGVQAQTPEAVMKKAASAYTGMKTIRAEFEQTITNPLTGTNSTSRGVMLRRAPDLLAVNFTNPKGDRVVADGKALWVYIPSSAPGQVIRLPSNGKSTLAMFEPGELFLNSASTRYTITSAGSATVGGRKANVISLVPKKGNNAFTRAKVWVDADDSSIRRFEVVDVNGLTRVITITKLEGNVPVSASEFKFTPPKNVRVLDSAAMGGND